MVEKSPLWEDSTAVMIDFPDWTPENCVKHVEEACKANGKKYFIPCLTSGLPGGYFRNVYEAVS